MQSKRCICLFLSLLVLLTGTLTGLASANSTETQKQVTELEKVVKALEEGIKAREKRLNELNEYVTLTAAKIQKSEKDVAIAQKSLDDKNRIFGKRVRTAYMKGGFSYLEMLLNAESFGDLITRLLYMKHILGRDAEVVSALRDEYRILSERKAYLLEEQAKLADLRYQIDAEHQNLLAEKQEKDKLLKGKKDQLADEIARTVPQAEKIPVYGVILDNHSAARPQHGLSQASLVYEYEVEGKITRYLALFAKFPTKVGPVRSARLHSIILALENGIHYVHAGGSMDNIELKAMLKLEGTDALRNSKHFTRDSSRRAPHNLYVNLKELDAVPAPEKVVVRPAFISREGEPGKSCTVAYSNTYEVSYKYVEKKEYYHRYINDKQHFDATGTALQVRNIIVQYTPHYNDARGRATASLIGEGEIDFYAQGNKFKGIWRKISEGAPTRYYYKDGQEIERIYGQTWIQIVRP